jgi:hypothetical protein
MAGGISGITLFWMQSMESMMPQWKVYHGDISLSIGFRGINRSIRLDDLPQNHTRGIYTLKWT